MIAHAQHACIMHKSPSNFNIRFYIRFNINFDGLITSKPSIWHHTKNKIDDKFLRVIAVITSDMPVLFINGQMKLTNRSVYS